MVSRQGPLKMLLVVLVAQLCHAQGVSRQELQRRTAFANSEFGTRSTPGSQTDRGKAYIALGPPDEVKDIPEPLNGDITFPRQEWTYRKVAGVGTNVCVNFVDPKMNNTYAMAPLPCEAHRGEETEARRRCVLIRKLIQRTLANISSPEKKSD